MLGARNRGGLHATTGAPDRAWPQGRVGPIHRIANARMPNRCHVNPDLMCPAGFQLDFEQGGRDKRFQGGVVSDAVPSPVHHRHLVVRPRVPPDRRLDGAGKRIWMALHERVVDLVDASRSECSFQDRARSLLATTINQVPTSSRCTMPRRSGTPEVEIRKPAPARWLRTSGPPAQARVSRDADRFVDHDDVVVIVHDDDTFHLLRAYLDEPRMIGELDLQKRADADPVGLVDLAAVQAARAPSQSTTLLRGIPSIRATAASTRSPFNPSGTSSIFRSATSDRAPIMITVVA